MDHTRASHLRRSSEALALAAPAVSAYLSYRHLSLTAEPAVSTCTACGTLRLPGWNCNVRCCVDEKKMKRGRKKERAGRKIGYYCRVCGEVVDEEAPKKEKVKRTKEMVVGSTPAEEGKKNNASAKTGAGARARKKARKGATMGSLLKKQKDAGSGGGAVSGSGGYGLSLMDLLKTT